MKYRVLIAGLIMFALCGGWLATSLAQQQAPFDVEQTRKELEILEGILSTTLKYAADTESRENRRFGVVSGVGFRRNSDVESFYLYGQGAVFFIPNSRSGSSSRLSELNELSEKIDQIERQGSTTDRYLRTLERRIENSRRGFSFAVDGDFVMVPPLPPAPPEPPEPPEAPEPVGAAPRSEERAAYAELWEVVGHGGKEVSGDELNEWIRTNRARLNEELQEAEAQDSARRERTENIQDDLITALAQHGDSLSALGENEYISLIFLGGSESADYIFSSRRGHAGALVIAVQKSQLIRFKQGNMTMNDLRANLIEYEL